jgi:hypothetical protein
MSDMFFVNWVISKFNLTASAVMDLIIFVNLKPEGYKRNEQQQPSIWG